jgi:hypothetical protein
MMRIPWLRRIAVLGVFGLISLSGTQARAFTLFESWFTPTAYVEVLPTSYYVDAPYVSTAYYTSAYTIPSAYYATAYTVPSAYYATAYTYPAAYYYSSAYTYPASYYATAYTVPASYYYSYAYPTSYVAAAYTPLVASSYTYAYPTSYVATSYSPLVASSYSYVPTSYYYPSVYQSPITYSPTYYTAVPTVAMASSPCDGTTTAPRTYQRPASGTGTGTNPRTAPKDVESSAVDEPAKTDTTSGSGTGAGATKQRSSLGTPSDTGLLEPKPIDSTTTPPVVPTVPKSKEILDPVTPSGPAGDATKGAGGSGSPPPPIAPAGTEGEPPTLITPKDKDGLVQRSARRYVSRPFVRTTAKGDLNLLEGLVKSGVTGLPEEGVELTVSNKTRAFADRRIRSNSSGRYAVRLPDGDWTVSVTLNDGSLYPVRGLTVSNGQIVDDLGRDIPTLTITR